MANEESSKNQSKRKLSVKKSSTLREQAKKSENAKPKTRRVHRAASKIAHPFKAVKRAGKKEYYIPMPDNKAGKFLNKKRRLTPSYFVQAWRELRLVTWPNRKETTRLTIAVIIFAISFGTMIAIVDYGLDKVFRSLLLK